MKHYINLLRKYELKCILSIYGINIFKDKKVLEIGSGNGYILQELKKMSVDASGIDIASGSMFTRKYPSIIYYDGKNIPYNDNSFDVIYSSNCLEHILHLDEFELELQRVLKPGGIALHILPNHVWRFWTMLVHYFALPRRIAKRIMGFEKGFHSQQKRSLLPVSMDKLSHFFKAALFYPKHGERGNRFTEFFYFRPAWWKNHFKRNGWVDLKSHPLPIFYTDHTLFSFLTISSRLKLSRLFGSVVMSYKMTNKP